MMTLWVLLICAILLSFERLTYYFVSHNPEKWRQLCGEGALARLGGPVDALRRLFYIFKVLQLSLFFFWCMLYGQTLLPLPTAPLPALAFGATLIAFGLLMNFSVFSRLGKVGVFYGAQLGYSVPWINGFPFSLFRHPQYLGTLASIWGFFIVMRYPHGDWIYLPLLETVYYAWGARHEP